MFVFPCNKNQDGISRVLVQPGDDLLQLMRGWCLQNLSLNNFLQTSCNMKFYFMRVVTLSFFFFEVFKISIPVKMVIAIASKILFT